MSPVLDVELPSHFPPNSKFKECTIITVANEVYTSALGEVTFEPKVLTNALRKG